MTSQLLSAIAGIVLSLAFAYIPPLKKFFDSIGSDYKRTVMGAAIILVGCRGCQGHNRTQRRISRR